MNIAITGATGVLGSLLYRKLKEKGIHNISLFEGDIRQQKDVDQWIQSIDPEYLFHFAALVPVDIVNKDPFRAYEVNVGGTIHLLSALQRENKKPWFFYASTSHVYKSSDTPLSEDSTEDPINFYGVTKLNAEKICESFVRSHGLNLCIGRIFSFYHASQKGPFLYPTIMKRFETEDMTKPFPLRGAKSVRDIINAEEIVELILKMTNKKPSGTFNIAGGKGITIEDFVKKIYNAPITIEALDTEKNSLVADVTRLTKLLND